MHCNTNRKFLHGKPRCEPNYKSVFTNKIIPTKCTATCTCTCVTCTCTCIIHAVIDNTGHTCAPAFTANLLSNGRQQ